MHIVYLGLGTNLGSKRENLKQATQFIKRKIGKIISQSSLYETIPWGYQSDNLFINMVIKIETEKSPFEILSLTKEIEQCMGRIHKTVNAVYQDRVIDIDILFYDDNIIDSNSLKIPHPLIADRLFVLEPLNEIAADFIHPILHLSINQLKQNIQCIKKDT